MSRLWICVGQGPYNLICNQSAPNLLSNCETKWIWALSGSRLRVRKSQTDPIKALDFDYLPSAYGQCLSIFGGRGEDPSSGN